MIICSFILEAEEEKNYEKKWKYSNLKYAVRSIVVLFITKNEKKEVVFVTDKNGGPWHDLFSVRVLNNESDRVYKYIHKTSGNSFGFY